MFRTDSGRNSGNSVLSKWFDDGNDDDSLRCNTSIDSTTESASLWGNIIYISVYLMDSINKSNCNNDEKRTTTNNMKINLFILLRTFCPHLGSFCVVSSCVVLCCDREQLWKAVITGDTVTRLSIPIRGRGKSPEEGQRWNLAET